MLNVDVDVDVDVDARRSGKWRLVACLLVCLLACPVVVCLSVPRLGEPLSQFPNACARFVYIVRSMRV